jgi:hypothetical protein
MIVNVSNASRLKNRKNDGSKMFLLLSLWWWLVACSFAFLLVFGKRGWITSLVFAVLLFAVLYISWFSFAMK